MAKFTVHAYRVVRQTFDDVEADTAEQAAILVRDNQGKYDSSYQDDDDNLFLGAVVDHHDDPEYDKTESFDWLETIDKQELSAKDKALADTREVLRRLIFTAPGTCGFEKSAPGYQEAWDAARTHLRVTCPNHIDDPHIGTCPNCHGDTAR